MKTFLERYEEEYNSKPLLWRVWNRLWWLGHNIYCAFANKIPYHQQMTLRVLKEEIENNKEIICPCCQFKIVRSLRDK